MWGAVTPERQPSAERAASDHKQEKETKRTLWKLQASPPRGTGRARHDVPSTRTGRRQLYWGLWPTCGFPEHRPSYVAWSLWPSNKGDRREQQGVGSHHAPCPSRRLRPARRPVRMPGSGTACTRSCTWCCAAAEGGSPPTAFRTDLTEGQRLGKGSLRKAWPRRQ